MVMTDVFSKFTQAVPTWDQKAATVSEVLVKDWFYHYGVQARLHSDQEKNFEREDPHYPLTSSGKRLVCVVPVGV